MYDGVKLFLEIVGWFFVLYLLGYSTFLFVSVLTGSPELYKHARREQLKVFLPADDQLPVSIIVPAHNEEITAADTVRSLLALDYRAYEIIVVDDGSTGDTVRVLTEAFGLHRIQRPIHRRVPSEREEAVYESRSHKVPLTLICKKNGGKADALNMGINASRFPYFICMDADSVLQYDFPAPHRSARSGGRERGGRGRTGAGGQRGGAGKRPDPALPDAPESAGLYADAGI